jgi:dihydropteroate synthase
VTHGFEFALEQDALRLEARAIPINRICDDPSQALWDTDRVRVVFRIDALAQDDVKKLCRETGGECSNAEGGLAVFEAKRERLAPLAGSNNRTAAILLHAHDAATSPYSPPVLMGILNVTPDSFSDGARFNELDSALERARSMAREGAAIIDIGGESTRPGSEPVTLADELARVLPVIEALAGESIEASISIDTRKAEVARRAVDAGATIVNDTSAGLHDPLMLSTVAALNCRYIAMHMQGTPSDMQKAPSYGDPVHEILCWLRERAAVCLEAGIAPGRLVLDPGIGFGKTLEHNVALVRRSVEFRSLGFPLLSGVSRKSFLGQLTGVETPDQRIGATLAAVSLCVAGGIEILRVHDVAQAAQAVAVAAAHSGLSTLATR